MRVYCRENLVLYILKGGIHNMSNILMADLDKSFLYLESLMSEELKAVPYLPFILFMMWKVILTLLVFFIGKFIIKLIQKALKKILNHAKVEVGVQQFFNAFTKFALYFILISIILVYFGVEASSIAALIGTAGLTIGLAMQGALSNLAGGVLILIFKPFKIGDYITEDNKKNAGYVSEITLLYTKLLTIDQTTVIVPNGVLANNSLKNTSLSKERRIDLNIGVAYDSDIPKAKEILHKICDSNSDIRKDKEIDIFVKDLGDYAVFITCRIYVDSDNYWKVRSEILENILLEFEKNQIEIPFPKLDIKKVN